MGTVVYGQDVNRNGSQLDAINPHRTKYGTFLLSYDVVESLVQSYKILPGINLSKSIGELTLKIGIEPSNYSMFDEQQCIFNSHAVVTNIIENYEICLNYLHDMVTKNHNYPTKLAFSLV